MDVLSMFPVAELSDLNNTDLSFLDNICRPDDNQHSEISNMADLNTVKGSSLNEINGLPVDWLSVNSCLDSLLGEASILPSTNFDQVLSPSISKFSWDSSTVTAESSSSTYQIHSPTDNSPFTEMAWPEERLYSSSDESEGKVTGVHCGMSSMSENSEITSPNVGDYKVAGKKYLQMRQKNNIASQRSRKLRKQKNLEMVERLKKLEGENLQLTKLVVELEKQRDALQKKLLQTISRK